LPHSLPKEKSLKGEGTVKRIWSKTPSTKKSKRHDRNTGETSRTGPVVMKAKEKEARGLCGKIIAANQFET